MPLRSSEKHRSAWDQAEAEPSTLGCSMRWLRLACVGSRTTHREQSGSFVFIPRRQQALEQGTLTSIFPTRLVCCRSANRESLLHIQLWSIRALSHPAAFTQLGLSSRLNRRSSNPASRRVASTPVTEHGSRSHEPRAVSRQHLVSVLD